MRKFVVLFAITIFFACSRQGKGIIQGKIENAGKEIVYFDEIKKAGLLTLDSAILEVKGKFNFTIPLINPGFYQIRLKDGKAFTLLLFPGEKIKIYADYNKFFETKSIDGFTETKRLISLDDSLRLVNSKLIKIESTYDSLKIVAGNKSKTDSLSRLFAQIMERHRKFSIKYILGNLKSLTNVEAIYQQYFSGDYVFNSTRDIQYYKLVSDTLMKYFPKVALVNALRDDRNMILSKYESERLMQLVKKADNHVPELNLEDRKGNPVSLYSLRGKIVFLTFWSVNQAESISNLEGLKKVYHKYKGKGFEIYQVSIDKSITDWKQSLISNEIRWPSVCDTAFPYSKTRQFYNVNKLPMNYLLNKDQTDILAKNISPEELDSKLEKILK